MINDINKGAELFYGKTTCKVLNIISGILAFLGLVESYGLYYLGVTDFVDLSFLTINIFLILTIWIVVGIIIAIKKHSRKME